MFLFRTFLFHTDFLNLCYSDVQAAKRWWIATFDCKAVAAPSDWDCPLPSDVALKLPGTPEPTILLCDQAEVDQAKFVRPNNHPMLFSNMLNKAHEHLAKRGAAPGPIQEREGPQFFEIRDPEDNVIEICREP